MLNQEVEKYWVHFPTWAVIKCNFKSGPTFYDISGKRSGRLSLQVYRDQILESVTKSWLNRSDEFILEEGHDSGYGD